MHESARDMLAGWLQDRGGFLLDAPLPTTFELPNDLQRAFAGAPGAIGLVDGTDETRLRT